MKKWVPYIIGLLIPVMIFISFAWMIKQRTFVFKDGFVKQGNLMVENIESDFQSLLNRDAIKKINAIEAKLQENKEAEGAINLLLKNLTVDSLVLDNLFVTDSDLNLKYFNDKNTLNKINEIRKAVKSEPSKDGFNAVYCAKGYYVYKSIPNAKIFASINTGFFQKIIREKYPFIQADLIVSQRQWYFNFSDAALKTYRAHKDLAEQIELEADKGKRGILKLKGDYVFGKKAYMKENNRELFSVNFFVYVNPAHYPMSLWHRILLVVNAILILAMFLMFLFKLKNESMMKQMDEYSDVNEDFLEKNPMTVYEAQNESPVEAVGDNVETEEEYLEIPDEYFNKNEAPAKKPNQELTDIISEVKDHEEEVSKYTSLWKNILGLVHNPDLKMMLGLIGEEDDQVIVHFQKNLEAESPLNISIDNWVIENYTLSGKSLWITEDALKASPVKQIFPFEYQLDANSVFIAPVKSEEGEIRGIFLLFSADKLEKSMILEMNSLIRMG